MVIVVNFIPGKQQHVTMLTLVFSSKQVQPHRAALLIEDYLTDPPMLQ